MRPGVVARLLKLLERTFPARCVRRYFAINGTMLAVVIAGHAFTALIPLLIVVASAAGSVDENELGERIVDRFNLSGGSASAVQTLFARPPDADGALSIVGVVLLVVSALSLSRALQRTYESAWGLPRALRGTLNGAVALTVLLTELVLLSVLASLLRGIPAGSVVTFVLRAGLAVALWLLLQHLLLAGRVAWRLLVPGAVVAGLGQQAVSLFSALWMPNLIERNAERYGVIGVSFALLSWLTVLAVVLVGAAVISAELGRARLPGRASGPVAESAGA